VPKCSTTNFVKKVKPITTYREGNPATGITSTIRTTNSSFGTSHRRKGGGFNPKSISRNYQQSKETLLRSRESSRKDQSVFDFKKALKEDKIQVIDENEGEPVVHKIPHLDDFFIQ